MSRKSELSVLDLTTETWQDYSSGTDVAKILQISHNGVSQAKFHCRVAKDRWFICDTVYKDRVNIQELKENGRLKVKLPSIIQERNKIEAINIYNYLAGKWFNFESVPEAAKYAKVTAQTIRAYLKEEGLVDNFYITSKPINEVILPETEYIVIPRTKEEKDATRRKYGLYPYGKWEQYVNNPKAWKEFLERCEAEANENRAEFREKLLKTREKNTLGKKFTEDLIESRNVERQEEDDEEDYMQSVLAEY